MRNRQTGETELVSVAADDTGDQQRQPLHRLYILGRHLRADSDRTAERIATLIAECG